MYIELISFVFGVTLGGLLTIMLVDGWKPSELLAWLRSKLS